MQCFHGSRYAARADAGVKEFTCFGRGEHIHRFGWAFGEVIGAEL